MSLIQIGAVALFGANLVGYFLHWGDQLAQIDKLLWMVLTLMVFGLEAIASMIKRSPDEDDH